MYRIPPPELVELAKILERTHFNDNYNLKPPRTPVHRSPYLPKTKSEIRKLDEQFEAWRASTNEAEDKIKKCRSAFDKALAARDRLKQSKKDRAQQIRDELNVCKITRLAKRAEEQEMLVLKSRSRITAWELERQQRRETEDRFQRKREAIDLVKQGQLMMTLQSNQHAELERFKALRSRMLESQAKRMFPFKIPSKLNAFETPGTPLFLVKLKRQLDGKEETVQGVNTRQLSLYDRHVQKMARLREAADATTVVTPVSIGKKERDHSLVRESALQESARINREVATLEKEFRKTKPKE